MTKLTDLEKSMKKTLIIIELLSFLRTINDMSPKIYLKDEALGYEVLSIVNKTLDELKKIK